MGGRSVPGTRRGWPGSRRRGPGVAAGVRWQAVAARRSSQRENLRAFRRVDERATGPGAGRGSGRSCRLPGEERRRFFEEVTRRQQSLVVGAATLDLGREGRERALAGEGLFALVVACWFPVTAEVRADAKGASGLSDGVALRGDKLDGLSLERGGGGASRSGHGWTSQGELTLLTWCPPFVGRSTECPTGTHPLDVYTGRRSPQTAETLPINRRLMGY